MYVYLGMFKCVYVCVDVCICGGDWRRVASDVVAVEGKIDDIRSGLI